MKKILSFVPAMLVASALTTSAQWYVNDFNSLVSPGGAYDISNGDSRLATAYPGLGITYSVANSTPTQVPPPNSSVIAFAYPPTLPPSPLSPNWVIGASAPGDSLRVALSGPVAGIKGDFWLTDLLGNDVPPQAGTLGATVKLSNGNEVPFVLGSAFYAPAGTTVSEFWVNQIGFNDNSFPTMDNFGVTAVPEPGVIVTNVVVILGALGGAWAYRRRQS